MVSIVGSALRLTCKPAAQCSKLFGCFDGTVLDVCWFYFFRQHKLDESLAYQQFSANVGEEESWINEKNTLVGSDDYGDTLAAVQVRIKFTYCIHSI